MDANKYKVAKITAINKFVLQVNHLLGKIQRPVHPNNTGQPVLIETRGATVTGCAPVVSFCFKGIY